MFLAPLDPVCRPGVPADLFPEFELPSHGGGAPRGEAERRNGEWRGSGVERWEQSAGLHSRVAFQEIYTNAKKTFMKREGFSVNELIDVK